MLNSYLPGYDPGSKNFEIASWTLSQEIVNGIINWKIDGAVYLNLLANFNNIMVPLFYSSAKNTFSFSGYDENSNNVNRQFDKNGNYHYLNFDLMTDFHSLMVQSTVAAKKELSILFNGTVIQTYKLINI